MMQIRVRLGAGLAPLAGNSRLTLTLAEEATVSDLLRQIQAEHPALSPKLERAIPMVGGRTVTSAEPLRSGQEVALLLPVAGGSH